MRKSKQEDEDLSTLKNDELTKSIKSYKIMAIVVGVIGLINLAITFFLWDTERSVSIQTALVGVIFFVYGAYVQTTKVAPRIAELASRS